MAGVPAFISDGPWWGLFAFLLGVVFLRAQGTYWAGWWLRRGAAHGAASPSHPSPAEAHALLEDVSHEEAPSADHHPTRRARLARRFSGPAWDRAQAFLDRWGFVGIPVSFLTIGFQTMVNAAAGFTRMRWDLYTLAMLPGCVAWAVMYSLVGLSLLEAWQRSPWLLAAILAGLIAAAWGFTRLRRSAGSSARTPR